MRKKQLNKLPHTPQLPAIIPEDEWDVPPITEVVVEADTTTEVHKWKPSEAFTLFIMAVGGSLLLLVLVVGIIQGWATIEVGLGSLQKSITSP